MDIKQIKALAKILNDAGLSALEVCEGETKVRLERAAYVPEKATAVSFVPYGGESGHIKDEAFISQSKGPEFTKEIKSPMVGVFYAAPAEDAAPFVKAGDRIKKGDVLCIIEAMKLMNEICAEEDGEIAEICIQNGQVVEYGQTLFRLV